MIRVELPFHLRTLAGIDGQVTLTVNGEVTRASILDALEACYPMLRGTIRDQFARQPVVGSGDDPRPGNPAATSAGSVLRLQGRCHPRSPDDASARCRGLRSGALPDRRSDRGRLVQHPTKPPGHFRYALSAKMARSFLASNRPARGQDAPDSDRFTMNSETPLLDDPYVVVSVQRSDTPPGAEGTEWHRYEIIQGKNKIKGYRRGSREDVTEAVTEIAARLNERRAGKRGRVKLTAPQKKKQ